MEHVSSSHASAAPHVVVVGAGIVGLAHAVAALDAGYRVTVLEQDAQAVSASIRNFGHVGASVQSGEVAALARASRPIWLRLGASAGVDVRVSGTLVIARTDIEAQVLEHLVDAKHDEDARLISGAEAAELLGIDASHAPRAAAMLPHDLTANPRTALARIAAWVQAHERGDVRFSTTVRSVGTGIVDTNRGSVLADHVFVAAGHVLGRLFPDVAEDAGIRECALQMARVRTPRSMPLGPAVLTGTSMLRYGAFDGPALEPLRAELSRSKPELLHIDANLMFTQQQDGTLLVGDSHITHDAAPPFLEETWSETLLGELATVLGAAEFEVLERWQGVYATSTQQDILVAHPVPGVTAVTVTTGVGMTVGLGLGARNVAELSLLTRA